MTMKESIKYGFGIMVGASLAGGLISLLADYCKKMESKKSEENK